MSLNRTFPNARAAIVKAMVVLLEEDAVFRL
jgi:hypothetical protein